MSARILRRCFSQIQGGAIGKKPPTPTGASSSSTPAVTGLSPNCVKPSTSPVGPGASPTGDYKVPEYFNFNRFSFAEAEVEMAKYRCPQPSALKK